MPLGWSFAVAVLYLALVTVYMFVGLWRYDIFRAGIDDCIFTQVVNSASSGFSSTIEGSVNHLLVHFSPILYVAVPFVKLFHGARGLIILQSLLAAATILPLWGMAISRFPPWLAFAVTAVAATYPTLSAEAVGDFHELAFAPPLAATLVWGLDRRRWWVAITAATLLATIKEDQFVSLAFIGLAVAVMGRQDRPMRLCGLWVASIAAAAAVFYFGILRPIIDVHFAYFSLHYYEWWRFPSTPAGFAGLLSPLRPYYVLIMLLPLGFVPLVSRYAIFAIPGLAEVLLSHEAITMLPGTHYTATWSGYVLCAFVDGMSVLYRRSNAAGNGVLAFAFAASIWTSTYHSPTDPGFNLYRRPSESDRLREQALASLPLTASVGSGVYVLPHIAMNRRATIAIADQDYFVFDHFTDPTYWIPHDAPTIQHLVRSEDYEIVYDGAGIVVVKRKP